MEKLKNKIEILKAENLKLNKKVKMLETRLTMSNIAFLNIVGRSLDGIVIINQHKMVLYTNYAAIKLFDKNIDDLLGKPLDLQINLEQTMSQKSTELKINYLNGDFVVTDVSVVKTEWYQEPCYIIIFKDITERKKNQITLEYKLEHDHLTSLPNRLLFEKKINEDIQINKNAKLFMALLYLDIDDFKNVNDTLGHDEGDRLLKIIANTLTQCTRTEDTVARLGGDEFAVIINQLKKPEDAEIIAKNILTSIRKISNIMGNSLFISLSIGIAIYPKSGETLNQLLRNADAAMYCAKNNGKNQYMIYDPLLIN